MKTKEEMDQIIHEILDQIKVDEKLYGLDNGDTVTLGYDGHMKEQYKIIKVLQPEPVKKCLPITLHAFNELTVMISMRDGHPSQFVRAVEGYRMDIRDILVDCGCMESVTHTKTEGATRYYDVIDPRGYYSKMIIEKRK
jgi:hypothetical protein